MELRYWSKGGLERVYVNDADGNSMGYAERRPGREITYRNEVKNAAARVGLVPSQRDDVFTFTMDDDLLARIADFVITGNLRDEYEMFAGMKRHAAGVRWLVSAARRKAEEKAQAQRIAAFSKAFA